MKFEEFYLDGFGIFHHYQVSDLASGLTIFLGANEAGKSTLLSFLKRLLFGFPDKRSRLNLYPPLAGGRHGGRLRIASSHTADLINMWDDGRKMQEAREQLQKIPPLEKFPEKGLENLEKNKEDIAKSNESITEKK